MNVLGSAQIAQCNSVTRSYEIKKKIYFFFWRDGNGMKIFFLKKKLFSDSRDTQMCGNVHTVTYWKNRVFCKKSPKMGFFRVHVFWGGVRTRRRILHLADHFI